MTPSVASERASITVATWSGIYGRALETEVFKPFTRETGINVRILHHNGDFGALEKAGREAGPPWQVVDVDRATLTVGCAEGRFTKIDPELLLGKAAAADFRPGTLHACGIGALIWSQAVVYDVAAYDKTEPGSLDDFFDIERFPGVRGLFAGAEGNLEIALMADGVPPSEVYQALRRPEGVDRAMAKLQSLGEGIAFWTDGDAAERLLNQGRVTMTTAYAGRFLRPRQGARRPVRLIFANQLWRATFWAIPTGFDDPIRAQRFVTFATDAERLARLASRLWFGTARQSADALVPATVRDELPTARRHFHDALAVDTGFWAEMGPALEARFRSWRAGIQKSDNKRP